MHDLVHILLYSTNLCWQRRASRGSWKASLMLTRMLSQGYIRSTSTASCFGMTCITCCTWRWVCVQVCQGWEQDILGQCIPVWGSGVLSPLVQCLCVCVCVCVFVCVCVCVYVCVCAVSALYPSLSKTHYRFSSPGTLCTWSRYCKLQWLYLLTPQPPLHSNMSILSRFILISSPLTPHPSLLHP